MFSGLSEYLFGSSSNQAGDAAMATDDTQPADPIKEVEMDDDWVLVDVTNDSGASSPRRSPRRSPTKDGCQSQPKAVPEKHQRMEESWFITPPPCFTAGGHSPHQLATSPLEDLLIEHPSMSVYHHSSQRGGPMAHPRQHHPRQKPNRTVAKRTHNLRVRNAKPPRRAAAIAARVGIEQSSHQVGLEEQREAKRHQQRQNSPGKIERHNKVYHHQSASSRRHYKHNSSISGRHSGAIYKQPR
ncbi:tumor protein p53-inducible nuclear protein 2-like [Lytechinus variegatus]|uniref:tumor protein p53-inducible nuclear protein 2-like n=1 Tax=Lytechinus variegatus TaxID=7654 RepID=UPI001BB118D9|nr:tumor protein p53-inducible nuclear protein 2-like [Lytechinus variegatus]